MKKWWHWVLLFAVISLVVVSCAGLAGAVYFLWEKPETPVEQATEEESIQALMFTPDIEALVQERVATAMAAQLTAESTVMPQPVTAGWHNVEAASLPDPQGYPGWIQTVSQQQSDGISRLVELTVRTNQIAMIFGDEAVVPGLGKVGANNKSGGCYLLVVVGSAVWDTQPAAGEWAPIKWPGRSAWDLHDAKEGTEPLLWMAQKAHDLAQSYPATCGVGIDLWVYTP